MSYAPFPMLHDFHVTDMGAFPSGPPQPASSTSPLDALASQPLRSSLGPALLSYLYFTMKRPISRNPSSLESGTVTLLPCRSTRWQHSHNCHQVLTPEPAATLPVPTNASFPAGACLLQLGLQRRGLQPTSHPHILPIPFTSSVKVMPSW